MALSTNRLEYQRAWREKNRQKVRDAANSWGRRNRKKRNADARTLYRTKIEHSLWYNAKKRAEKAGLPFTITVDDVRIPSVCPVLGIPIFVSRRRMTDNSPSLDRRYNDLGYIPGNVEVISMRANRIKADASFKEIQALYFWMAGTRI